MTPTENELAVCVVSCLDEVSSALTIIIKELNNLFKIMIIL